MLASAPFVAVMRPRSALLPGPHWCELPADFYPTVKAALRHESADSEEDREGLECHLGQGPLGDDKFRVIESLNSTYTELFIVFRL